MIDILIPFAYKPRDYQLAFLRSSARFKIAVWHRRGGKSKTVLNQQIAKTQLKKGVYLYVLPTYRQSKSVIWDELIRVHVPMEIVEKKNDSELAIYYKNGSIQRFVGCEDIDKHRGINPIDVVFDEYSEMREEMWTAIIQPVLRENGGTATFIFTPKGKNHAWKLLEQAKERSDWFVSVKTVEDTKALPDAEIIAAKRETPEALFRQEYLCSFEEGAGSFFRGVRSCVDTSPEGRNEPRTGFRYRLGIDLGKHLDFTCLAPFCLNDFRIMPIERFNQMDWNVQKQRIITEYKKWNAEDAVIDSTGLGDPITDDLALAGLNMRPFKFTEGSREQLLRHLSLLIEQKAIKLPDDPILLSELESMRYVLGANGKVKIQVPDGLHDDCIMSLALAVWGQFAPIGQPILKDERTMWGMKPKEPGSGGQAPDYRFLM